MELSGLGKDLLLKILGFIDISDIKTVPLVCAYWNNLFKSAPFWQPFVERKLKGFPVCTHNAAMFHKYSSSLKLGFGWIFQEKGPNWLNINEILLDDNDNYTKIRLRDGKQVSNICYIIDRKKKLYEKFVLLHPSLKYLNFINNPLEILEIRSEQDGIKFVGSNEDKQAKKYFEIVPHGAGTWTFPDGSTFSGDKVACEGFPHGKGLWNGKEEVEFEFGHRVTPTYKRRKIKF